MKDQRTTLSLRISPSLHRKLSDSATENSRSINAEIVKRLEVSFDLDSARKLEELRDTLEQRFERRLSDMQEKYNRALDGAERTFTEVRVMLLNRLGELDARIGEDEGKE